MPDDTTVWSDEVRKRLAVWASWTRGNQLIRGSRNVLADMIKRAAGEVPGADSATPYEFTFDIEVTDKAIASMRIMAAGARGRKKRRIKAAKRVLMSTYLGRLGVAEIAERLNCSENYVRALLWYAESFVGRMVPEIENRLRDRENARILGRVSRIP